MRSGSRRLTALTRGSRRLTALARDLRREQGSRRSAAIATAASVLLIVCGVGCGGGGSAVIVSVGRGGRNVITRAMFDHWMLVAALRDGEGPHGRAAKPGAVPDPPDYTACIRYLGENLPPPVSRETLKNDCRRQRMAIKEQVLSSLITGEWFIAEGEARGFKVSVREEHERVTQVAHTNRFASPGSYQRFLRHGAETDADRLFRARITLFSGRIQQQLEASSSLRAREIALQRFGTIFPTKWASETSCRRGFVVPNCKQYRGAQHPEIRMP